MLSGLSRLCDELFTGLADPHRRRELGELLETDPESPLAIPEDVHRKAADRDILHAKLVHFHLSSLEGRGFVDWDREAEIVTRGPGSGTSARTRRSSTSTERTWADWD